MPNHLQILYLATNVPATTAGGRVLTAAIMVACHQHNGELLKRHSSITPQKELLIDAIAVTSPADSNW